MEVSLGIYVCQLQGRIQDFLKGGSENLKKGIWSVAPEAIGIVLLNIKIIHLHEYMYSYKQLSNQVSVASYMISAKVNQPAWVSRLIFANSSNIKNGSELIKC